MTTHTMPDYATLHQAAAAACRLLKHQLDVLREEAVRKDELVGAAPEAERFSLSAAEFGQAYGYLAAIRDLGL